jgi:hypothetical protein
MKGTTRFTSSWTFFAIVALLTGCLLASPLQANAQNCSESQGNNAVYNTTDCNNGNPVVVGSSSFIDASMFASSAPNICAVLNGILRSNTYPPASAPLREF